MQFHFQNSSRYDASHDINSTRRIKVTVMSRRLLEPTKNGYSWFSANMIDQYKNEYTIKFFREAAVYYDKKIRQGTSYLIEKPKFDTININDCNWEIYPCPKQTKRPDNNQGNLNNTPRFTPLNQIKNKNSGEIIDTAAYVKEIGSLMPGTHIMRKVNLIDDTNHEIEMTLWGNLASNVSFKKNNLIFIENARVSVFRNIKSIDSNFDRMIIVSNPQEFPRDHPEIERLKNWQPERIATENPNNFVSQETRTNQNFNCKIRKIQEIKLGAKGEYFDADVIISSVESNLINICYFKCSRDCDKKQIVLEDSDNMIFKCENCKTEPTCNYVLKMTVKDETGTLLVVAFNSIAQNLIGIEAKRLFDDEDEAERYLGNICQKKANLSIVVDENNFNGQVTKEFKVVQIKNAS